MDVRVSCWGTERWSRWSFVLLTSILSCIVRTSILLHCGFVCIETDISRIPNRRPFYIKGGFFCGKKLNQVKLLFAGLPRQATLGESFQEDAIFYS